MFVFRKINGACLTVFPIGGAVNRLPERGFAILLVTSAVEGVNPGDRLRVRRPRWHRRGDLNQEEC
jgi:hypothetical protein